MKKTLTFIGILLFAGLQILQAQTRTITGTVTSSEDGSTVPGVTIVVKGNNQYGTVTDIDGNFTLSVPENATTLVVSYVGMITQEVSIVDRTEVSVTLEPDVLGLEEVVVLGYSTLGKNQITGSTVQVDAADLKEIPVTSVDQTLQGKVPGLIINTSSGTPGSIQDIRIRGVSSLTASNSPLIVVDGVPVTQANVSGSTAMSSLSSLAAINSNDIESITVLKDASATSAYGARGSNGVIVITTIKGKAGKTKFNLSTNYGFQNKAIPGRQVLTASQREELYLEGVLNTFGAANGLTTPDDAYNYAIANGLYGASGYEEWRAAGRPEEDWGQAVLNKNAPVYNFDLSASGGDDVSTYYTSFGYTKNEAVVVGNVFERFTGQLNYKRKMSDKLQFSTTNTFSYTNQDKPFLETSAYFGNPHISKFFMPPTIPARNPDGTPNIDYNSSLFNILYLQEHNVRWNHMLRLMSNNFVEYEIVKGLKFKSLAAFDYILAHYKNYRNRHHGDSKDENGTSYASINQDINMVFQNSLDYSLNLNDHKIDFKALVEYQKYKNWFVDAYGESFVTDGLTNVSSAGTNFDASSSFSDWVNLSYLGMVNYNYNGKYIADFTFRREGSSRFALDHRFGSFWALGAAWNLSQEAFMSNMTWINSFRLRGSYGISGNSGIGLNQYQSLLAFNADYAGLGASYPSGYGNNLLTWEKNRNYDVGIDFAFFNKIDGSISYFNKKTYDLLQNVPLTLTSGHSSITSNVGSMVNRGVEAIVHVDIVRKRDFNFGISFNIATLHNEITELAKDGEGNDIDITTGTAKVAVGHSYYEWFLREWAGVDPDTGLPQWKLNTEDDPNGLTGDINQAERVFMGYSPLPTYSGGGGIHIDFKGVYFEGNVYVAGGHKIMESWTGYTWDNGLYATGLFNGIEDLMTRWQQPGDVTNVPMIQYAFRPDNAVGTSSRFLLKGDYLRVKDMVLGYMLPSSLTSKAGLNDVNIYVRGTNLFTYAFDKDTRRGFDPETRADGFTGLETPPIKSIVFGLNLNF